MQGLIQQEQVVIEEVVEPVRNEEHKEAENQAQPRRSIQPSSNSQHSFEEEDRGLLMYPPGGVARAQANVLINPPRMADPMILPNPA